MNFKTSEDPKPTKLSFGTRFQQRLDGVIGTIAPSWQLQRMQSRAQVSKLQHQYAGAETGRDRSPPQPLRSPDSPSAQSDALIMQRRSQDLGRNSAFIDHLAAQYKIYALGDIQYIPNTGNRAINQKYRDYWQQWMLRENSDAQGRFHFIDMMQMSLAGVIYNGRHGFIHHHGTDGTFKIQSIMGYNIGNPRAIYTNPQLVSGMVLDDSGRVVGYDLYRLGINGTVSFVMHVPAYIFSCLNPVESTDEYVAKTPLHAVLNDAHDMRRVESAWMQKIQWAAYKTAVFNTPNGSPPDGDPNADPLNFSNSSSPAYGRVRHQLPGEEMHGEEGFNVEMLRNETPTNNETDFLVTKLAQISMALNLPLAFVWVMMGLPGTYTRLISEQAKRAFQHGPLGQKWLERSALNDIKRNALWAGIVRGDIPYEEDWNKGSFMYPAHPTVDMGRESKANIEENARGLLPMSVISGEAGRYWEDDDAQLAREGLNKAVHAYEISQQFNKITGETTTWDKMLPLVQVNSANPPAPGEETNTSNTEKA